MNNTAEWTSMVLEPLQVRDNVMTCPNVRAAYAEALEDDVAEVDQPSLLPWTHDVTRLVMQCPNVKKMVFEGGWNQEIADKIEASLVRAPKPDPVPWADRPCKTCGGPRTCVPQGERNRYICLTCKAREKVED